MHFSTRCVDDETGRLLAPTLEVTTSAGVLAERQRVALQGASRGILIGRYFLTLRGLAEACAAETDSPVRALLTGPTLSRLVRRCAVELSLLGPLLRRQPSVADALVGTFRDLRDAGIDPDSIPSSLRELRELYRRYDRHLGQLAREGLLDEVGLFRLALEGASQWGKRLGLRRAEVHGATELVGSQGDLLDRLAAAVPLRLYQPDTGDPHAAAVRARWPWSFRPEPARPLGDPAIARSGALHVIEVRGGPLEELERVAGEALRKLNQGSRPAELAIVARTLEPYASWLSTVLDRFAIPYTCTLSEPVLLHPAGRAVSHLLRVLLADLPADSVLELLRAPPFASVGKGVAELASRLAHHSGIRVGRHEWDAALDSADDLVRELKRPLPHRSVARLRRTLGALLSEGDRIRAARSWDEAVDRALEAVDRWLPPSGPAHDEPEALAREAACSALSGLRFLDSIDARTPGSIGPGKNELLTTTLGALAAASFRTQRGIEGGVRVLDAVQARGLRFGHLFLIGLNDRFWPRMLDDDPFLPDEVRTRLRDELKRPVPVRREIEQEERALLHLLLAQTQHSVVLSFHSFDAAGRESAPSPYLRDWIEQVPESEPLDPVPEVDAPSLLPLRAAQIAAGLREGERGLRRLPDRDAERRAAIERGLRYLEAIESFDGSRLEFDGLVGGAAVRPDPVLRPTRLETLGRCPLRAFFGDILRVPESLRGSTTELQARETGSLIHDVLRRVYEALAERGLLVPGTDPAVALSASRETLEEVLGGAERLGGVDRPQSRGLWDGMHDQLLRGLGEFLHWDLHRLLPGGLESLACEDEFETELDLGQERLVLRGKIDRWTGLPAGDVCVSDYKTGAPPERSLSTVEIQGGRSVQLPLYALHVAATRGTSHVRAELLHVPLRPERLRGRRSERSFSLKEEEVEHIRLEVGTAVGTLRSLLQQGQFPFRRGAHCSYCPYTLACRQQHPASARRVREAEPYRRYFAMAETRR
ncbi:MAG: PD-(D/E)XK nuclease family protein [Myxococcota bacterium]